MKKIALITGATSGFGKATAFLLAKNSWDLIITGRRADRLKEIEIELVALGIEVKSLCFDVQNRSEVESAIDSLSGRWTRIDVLLNNAGLAVGTEHVVDGVLDDWDRMIDTNVKGLLYVIKKVIPLMKERKKGQIINMSSIAGKEAYPGGSVYCASKHGVQAISNALRIELLPYNIKVSTICPGLAETEFSVVRFKGDHEKADGVYNGVTPLYANDIAETVLFLVSRPKSVNISELVVMPTAQASARDVLREE